MDIELIGGTSETNCTAVIATENFITMFWNGDFDLVPNSKERPTNTWSELLLGLAIGGLESCRQWPVEFCLRAFPSGVPRILAGAPTISCAFVLDDFEILQPVAAEDFARGNAPPTVSCWPRRQPMIGRGGQIEEGLVVPDLQCAGPRCHHSWRTMPPSQLSETQLDVNERVRRAMVNMFGDNAHDCHSADASRSVEWGFVRQPG